MGGGTRGRRREKDGDQGPCAGSARAGEAKTLLVPACTRAADPGHFLDNRITGINQQRQAAEGRLPYCEWGFTCLAEPGRTRREKRETETASGAVRANWNVTGLARVPDFPMTMTPRTAIVRVESLPVRNESW